MQPITVPRWRSGTASTERRRSAATDAAVSKRSSRPASTVTTGSPVCAARSAIERLTEAVGLEIRRREVARHDRHELVALAQQQEAALGGGQLDRGVDDLVEDSRDIDRRVEPARQREQAAQVRGLGAARGVGATLAAAAPPGSRTSSPSASSAAYETRARWPR